MRKLLWVVLFVLSSSTFVHAQTIADKARAERARREQQTGKSIVITNDDIKPAPAPEVSGTKDAPKAEAAPAKPEGDARDEKYWRAQFAKVREQIQRLQTEIPVLENAWNAANREFLTRSYDPDGRGQRAIADSKARLDAAKAELASAQALEEKLQDDLRRAGAPAGWAR